MVKKLLYYARIGLKGLHMKEFVLFFEPSRLMHDVQPLLNQAFLTSGIIFA
jgi:hypothetical protein